MLTVSVRWLLYSSLGLLQQVYHDADIKGTDIPLAASQSQNLRTDTALFVNLNRSNRTSPNKVVGTICELVNWGF
jgi:hypothetical protein